MPHRLFNKPSGCHQTKQQGRSKSRVHDVLGKVEGEEENEVHNSRDCRVKAEGGEEGEEDGGGKRMRKGGRLFFFIILSLLLFYF